MKKYDFTRFIVDEYGSVETKRVQTNSERYLVKNLLPETHDESGSMYMKYFKAEVFYRNNKTNEFIEDISYEYVDYNKRKLFFDIVNNEIFIEHYKNFIN